MLFEDIADLIENLNKNIADHENRSAKIHPESAGAHIMRKRILYLKKAREGLESYKNNMETFWSLDQVPE